MFIIIGGMLVVVALFFLIFVEDGGPETALILLAITALLFVVSRVTPWLERRRAMSAPHEAVITRDGIVYEGSVYPFRSFLVFWHGVTLRNRRKRILPRLFFPSPSSSAGSSSSRSMSWFRCQPVRRNGPGGSCRQLGGDIPDNLQK